MTTRYHGTVLQTDELRDSSGIAADPDFRLSADEVAERVDPATFTGRRCATSTS